MMDAGFNASVNERIEALRRQRGDQVGLDQIGDIIAALLQTIAVDAPDGAGPDIGCLYDQLFPILTPGFRAQKLVDTIDHLRQVVTESETATNTILEAGESLEQLADVVDPQTADMITNVVTRIYQASNFQDIGGQRIAKAIDLLQALAGRLDDLATMIGPQALEAWSAAGGRDAGEDDKLLDGPQLSDSGNSQEDIDALLASFD